MNEKILNKLRFFCNDCNLYWRSSFNIVKGERMFYKRVDKNIFTRNGSEIIQKVNFMSMFL